MQRPPCKYARRRSIKKVMKELNVTEKGTVLYVFPEICSVRVPKVEDFWLAGRKLLVWHPLKAVPSKRLRCPCGCDAAITARGHEMYARRWIDMEHTNFVVTWSYRVECKRNNSKC
jgi:predicted secreted Zn-dependent protease